MPRQSTALVINRYDFTQLAHVCALLPSPRLKTAGIFPDDSPTLFSE